MPIGGFISAQLAELWALWKEHTQLMGQPKVRESFEENWNKAMQAHARSMHDFLSPHCARPMPNHNTCVRGFICGPTDFTAAAEHGQSMTVCSRMLRSGFPHLVSWDSLKSNGFHGWWAPVESMMAVLEVEGLPVLFAKSTPWDRP